MTTKTNLEDVITKDQLSHAKFILGFGSILTGIAGMFAGVSFFHLVRVDGNYKMAAIAGGLAFLNGSAGIYGAVKTYGQLKKYIMQSNV
ncbi:MAG: hypothetical protein AABW88_04130 [Nanoarchaeota archaeon]